MTNVKLKRKNEDVKWAIIFLTPITIGMILFVLVPILAAIGLSFTKYDLFNAPVWRGLRNYERLFNPEMEQWFWPSFRNIIIFALIVTVLSIGIGLVLAVMLNRVKHGSGVFKMIYYIPMVCSTVATTAIWAWMYNDNYGPITQLLQFFGVVDYQFFSPTHAMPSMILMCVWGGFSGSMLLYFATLKNIPSYLYEAAEIDGANEFRCFFKITLPMVSPTTFYLLLTGLVGNLQAYSQFLSIGLDNYTPVLVIYKYAGHGYGTLYGYACAMGVVYGLFVGVIALINFKLSKYWVGYDV